MSKLGLAPATSLPLDRLAALFTAGYEDYYAPLRIDAAALGFMVRAWDLDLDASRVALRDGEPVGLCMLGLRGDEAWIGGLGVVVAERRHGIGARLMEAVLEQARARAAREVRLEVIRENERAIPLYERLGFEWTRGLDVWLVPGAHGTCQEIAVDEAHRRVQALRLQREPWQRDDRTVGNLDDLTGLAAEDGAAVVRVSNGRVSILQLAGEASALRSLVASARSLGDPVVLLNLPAGHAAAAVLPELGGRLDITQHELALRLA